MKHNLPIFQTPVPKHPDGRPWRLAGVKYFNACPILHGLEQLDDFDVTPCVPSGMDNLLHNAEVDLALAPIMDWLLSQPTHPLRWLGGNGIMGTSKSATVLLYHNGPLDNLTQIYTDTDSHTSVQLLRVILQHLTGRCPLIRPLQPNTHPALDASQAVLLIGDKNLHIPNEYRTAHVLDLASEWTRWQGLPFVFAGWLAPQNSCAGLLITWLTERTRMHLEHTLALSHIHAPKHGWEIVAGSFYLKNTLSYIVTPAHIQSVTKFHHCLTALNLINLPLPPLPQTSDS